MPRSKRVRAVALTQTSKKTRQHKSNIIQSVRDAIDKHQTLYLFSYENMRSDKFKSIRMHFRENNSDMMDDDDNNNNNKNTTSSRIFLGKNKLIQIAMGRTPEDEYSDNIRHVSKLIKGSVGLLLTNRPHQYVESFFNPNSSSSSNELFTEDYARAGSTAPKNITISNDDLQSYSFSMLEQFRKLGMPVELENGTIVLSGGREEYVICRGGQVLSAEQCKLLVHFGRKLSRFRVDLVCRYGIADGSFEMLSQG